MDVKKLEVDESQISKTTGRIILPADDGSRAAAKAPVARPRMTPHATPQAHAVAPPTAHAQQPYAAPPEAAASPAALPGVARSAVSPVQALIIGILISLLVIQTSWLFWSHSQLQGSIRTLHDQVIRLNTEMAASSEANKVLGRELVEMKVLLSRAAEEQKNQARSIADIKAQLQAFDDGTDAESVIPQP